MTTSESSRYRMPLLNLVKTRQDSSTLVKTRFDTLYASALLRSPILVLIQSLLAAQS
ncbi:hypothetical protein PCANC_25557 [Puccinia coronata f. sp. avenae]|uniref:Uncharacterized protein n=1 Tax=Puccinia coronata f. sp. avenae TaxID=200324 RepID=A0A2N5TWN8_9BASI|nr:hypothetical protein PCANC_25557 [Puccinia coronata f. sp. avenae]